jgi:hypothetical protein
MFGFGLGAYGGSFWQGYRDRSDQLLGQRQKVAEAWNQFKQQNPEASYNDFRQFVDSMTGGDSYLRGALPADDILKSLAEEGVKKKKAREAEEAARAFETKVKTADTMKAVARRAYEAGKMDPNEAIDFALKDLDLQDPGQQENVRRQLSGMDLPSLFKNFEDDDRLNTLNKALPLIKEGAIGSEGALADFLPSYLRGKPQGDNLLGALKTSYGSWMEDRKSKLFNDAVQYAQFADDLNPDQLMTMVRTAFPKADPDTIQPLFKAIYSRAQQERARIEQDRAEQRAERQRVEDERRQALFFQTTSQLAQDPMALRILQTKGIDAARRYLTSAPLPPGVGREVVDAALRTMSSRGDVMLDATRTEEWKKAMGAVPKQAESLVAASAKRAGGYFGPKSELAKYNPALPQVAQTVFQSYALSPDDLAVIYDYMGKNRARWQNLGAADLQKFLLAAGGSRFQSAADIAKTLEKRVSTSLPGIQSTRQFIASTRSEARARFNVLDGKVAALAKLPPDARDFEAQKLINEVNQNWQGLTTSITEAGTNQDRWTSHNGEGFDIAGMKTLLREVDDRRNTLIQKIKTAANPPPVPRAAGQTAPRPAPAPAGNENWRRIQEQGAKRRAEQTVTVPTIYDDPNKPGINLRVGAETRPAYRQ